MNISLKPNGPKKKTAGQAKVPYDRKNVWAPVHPFIIEDIREAIVKRYTEKC